jgi:hypothetical protein
MTRHNAFFCYFSRTRHSLSTEGQVQATKTRTDGIVRSGNQ